MGNGQMGMRQLGVGMGNWEWEWELGMGAARAGFPHSPPHPSQQRGGLDLPNPTEGSCPPFTHKSRGTCTSQRTLLEWTRWLTAQRASLSHSSRERP